MDAREGKSVKELKERIFASIVDELYDQAVMDNLSRPDYVERMVAALLGDDWRIASGNWGAWDLQNDAKVRIEVKQSAHLQPHASRRQLEGRLTTGRFSIAPKKRGYVDNAKAVIEEPGRYADLYVFAWHGGDDPATTDHRDPSQWRFFVIPTGKLKENQKSISVASVGKLTGSVSAEALRDRVNQELSQLRVFKKDEFPVPGVASKMVPPSKGG